MAQRNEYIELMDGFMLRQPLWLQLTDAQFQPLRARLPPPGLLVHPYRDGFGEMVEVHVDLDDSFDALRASLPLGGQFSVRFPGGAPAGQSLRPPPAELPEPGADLSPLPPANTDAADADPASPAAVPDQAELVRLRKLTVPQLKELLKAKKLPVGGKKAELVDRLASATARAAGADATGADAESEEEEEDLEEWRVKKVLARRSRVERIGGNEGGCPALSVTVVEYLVQYDWIDPETGKEEEPSWQPEAYLANSHEAVYNFLASQPKAPGCKYNHLVGSCRCGQPIVHSGQDESIFKAYQKSNYQYVVNGVRGLRKKGDGPGEMVSGYKDELRGFGHPLTPQELRIVNIFRKARGKVVIPPLTPHLCTFTCTPLSHTHTHTCTCTMMTGAAHWLTGGALPHVRQEQGWLLDV